jgi:hypothetical protein
MPALKNGLSAHLFKNTEYWRARGDRAIARSLVAANTTLVINRARLETSRRTISILATMPQRNDARHQRLGDRIACYLVREAELARRVGHLGRRLDRCVLTQ